MQARPRELADIDPARLSPFLRALLTIDGTVTQFLQAFAAERVVIELLDQAAMPAGAAAAWLDCGPDTGVLRRRSMLSGEASGRMYAYAESLIVPDRLPRGMLDGLRRDPGGLGKIIVDSRLETRREALWYGRELPPAQLPADVRARAVALFLTRSYRIFSAGLPLMQITERFPLDGEQLA